jgi:hypothetical protein
MFGSCGGVAAGRRDHRDVVAAVPMVCEGVLEPGDGVGDPCRCGDADRVGGDGLEALELNSRGDERLSFPFLPQVDRFVAVGVSQVGYVCLDEVPGDRLSWGVQLVVGLKDGQGLDCRPAGLIAPVALGAVDEKGCPVEVAGLAPTTCSNGLPGTWRRRVRLLRMARALTLGPRSASCVANCRHPEVQADSLGPG